MATIQIRLEDYKKMINAVKRATSRDASREYLKYVKLCVFKDKIVAYGCNGYFALRYTTSLANEDGEEFTAFILPKSPKTTKKYLSNWVTISHDEKTGKDSVQVEVNDTETVLYTFDTKIVSKDYKIPLDQLFDQDTAVAATVSITAQNLVETASSFVGVSQCVTIETSSNPTSPVKIMTMNDGSTKLESIVLPVRR